MELKWTRKLPTQAGWYWSKFLPPGERHTAAITIVHLVKNKKNGRIKCGQYALEELAKYGERQWAGPLVPPNATWIEE